MTPIFLSTVLIRYFEDMYQTTREVASLTFVIQKHVEVTFLQRKQLQKSCSVDFISPLCSKTHMHFAKHVKIVKNWGPFQKET